MNDFTVTNSNADLTLFKEPTYRCAKHGEVKGSVRLYGTNGSAESDHCLECYKEWIRANIPAVTPT